MKAARKLLVAWLAALVLVALPVTATHALQVKVSINFGPTITGPDNGTLIVTANRATSSTSRGRSALTPTSTYIEDSLLVAE